MNNDLVSRSALIAEICEEYDIHYGEILIDPHKFADMVNFAPAVDAVEVVRCKDCKYHQIMENKKSFMYWHNCKLWCADITEDDFCSYGERKSDG